VGGSSIQHLPQEYSIVLGNINAKTGTEDIFKQFGM
jgi:hypothetical protein